MASILVGIVIAVIVFGGMTLFASRTGVGSSTVPAAWRSWRFVRGLFFAATALVFLSSGIPSVMLVGVIMAALGALWFVFVYEGGDVDVSP